MLLTKIPFFRETIIMSFSCGHCGYTDTSMQSAGEIQQKGSKYSFTLHHPDDMEHSVIKDEHGVFRIEDLDLEMPAGISQVTNLEGLLSKILKDLESEQKVRKANEPELYEKIDAIVQRLVAMMIGREMPFTVTLDDPSGNSWIQPSSKDLERKDKYSRTEYARTAQQNSSLGLSQTIGQPSGGEAQSTNAEVVPQIQTGDGDPMQDVDLLKDAMYTLETPCPGCSKAASMNLQAVNIPHFKEVVISSMICEHCGYRTNDVKTGGEVPELGKRTTLHVKDPQDLRRDLLKSESCSMRIPECSVEIAAGTMGGRFTTVEGLLTQMRDDLKRDIFHTDNPGDSMPNDKRDHWQAFFSQLDKAITGQTPFTVIISDPLDNSYIENLNAPDPDPKLIVEHYERTEEEMDDLGLADMKTKLSENGEYESESFEVDKTQLDKSTDGKVATEGTDRITRSEAPATESSIAPNFTGFRETVEEDSEEEL